ncbi:MAG: 4Fe-4S binding protein, partial [Rhodospirillales bacterium]|nr:4Fe-4S binding protein [Rhodospirillales bacterium]
MGTSYNTIAFHQDKCDGCGTCMSVCAKAKAGTEDVAQSRIKIQKGLANGGYEMALCRQCGDPKCVMVCPSGALTKDADTGVVPWNEEICVDCLLCT